MIKSISLVKRKPGLTHEEYSRYWLEQHGPLAAKVIPGMRRYVQNHLIEIPGLKYDIDGIIEMWWDDVEAYQKYWAWRQTPEGKIIQDDVNKFSDQSTRIRYIAQEHIIKDERP